MRYEVVIERRRDSRGIERLVVAKEEAKPILARDDDWKPGGYGLSSAFRDAYMKYGRRTAWLSTNETDSQASFQIHQDGHAGRRRSAEAAEATILSSITSAEFPHLYALREELRSWRFLQLDPAALRRPSPTTAAEELEPDGANLATVLARIQAETRTPDRPQGALADIGGDLASLVPGVVALEVVEDTTNREYRIDIGMREGPPFSSRVISDGTLRILALLTLLHDPKHRGLVCFEEPENGVHASRLKEMMSWLRELVSDTRDEEEQSQEEPLSQMLMNSHSPVVLSSLHKGESLFADLVSVVDHNSKTISRKTRMRPVRTREHQGQLISSPNDEWVSSFEAERILATPNKEY